MSSDGLTVSGSLVSSGGVLTTSTGTSLLAEADGEVLSSNGVRFKNLTTASGIYALGSPLRVEGNLVLNGGGLTTAGHPIILSGSYTNTAGTFNEGTGAVVLRGMTDRTLQLNEQFYDLHVEDPTENGLVGYWEFDEGAGATAVDRSGNGKDGTLTNMSAYAWTGATTSAIRFANPYALDFDGTDDYVSTPSGIVTNQPQLTASLWFNPDVTLASRAYAIYQKSEIFYIAWNTDATIDTALRTDDNSWATVHANVGSAPQGEWSHVAFTYKSGEAKTYINGSQIGSTVTSVTGDVYGGGGTQLDI